MYSDQERLRICIVSSPRSGMLRRVVTYFVALVAIFDQAAGELLITPRDTESKAGDTTYFNCSTNLTSKEIFWNHGDQYVSSENGILPPYDERFEIERNESIGSYNLVIHSVKPSDAGEYTCIDDDGHGPRRSAQLVVLENGPDCQSNIQPDGVIGQNVFNIAPDEVQLTCAVNYHGNILPQMEWKNVEDNDSANSSNVTSHVRSDNRITYILNLKGDMSLDNSSYVCQTKRSAHDQYKCYSKAIKILYFVSRNMTQQNAFRGEEIICIAGNNTFNCSTQWYHDNYNTRPLSCEKSIKTHLLGEYLCMVKCYIRGTDYPFTVLKAVVAEAPTSPPPSTAGTIIAEVVILIVFITLFALASVCILRYRIRKHKRRLRSLQPINEPLVAAAVPCTRQSDVTYIKTISTTAAELSRTITGIAILEKELFVTSENSSQIDVFETDTNEFKHSRTLTLEERREQLHNPVDIASCQKSQRLYIIDWDKKKPANNIHRIDRNGVLSNYWNTGKFRGTIFVTNDDKIIISFNRKIFFKIYTYKGDWIRTVFTNSANCRILHSIQLKCGQFVVSVKDERDCRILFLNDDSTVLQKFSGQGEDGKRSRYVYFALRGDDNVIVLDFKKKLIFSLDPTCAVNLQLLSERNGIKSPSRVCFDTSRNLLLIVDNKADYSGEISIYKVDP